MARVESDNVISLECVLPDAFAVEGEAKCQERNMLAVSFSDEEKAFLLEVSQKQSLFRSLSVKNAGPCAFKEGIEARCLILSIQGQGFQIPQAGF